MGNTWVKAKMFMRMNPFQHEQNKPGRRKEVFLDLKRIMEVAAKEVSVVMMLHRKILSL